MYRAKCKEDEPRRPVLRVTITSKEDGVLITSKVPENLQSMVHAGMLPSMKRWRFNEGVLNVFIQCGWRRPADERLEMIQGFIRRFAKRAKLNVRIA